MTPRRQSRIEKRTGRVTVVGAGNIGSALVPLLAHDPSVLELTIVDSDAYEPSNLVGQNIWPSDLGRPKARVQARRARRIRPALAVRAIVGRLEDVPLGLLRGDVLLGCLDSKRSRQQLNQAAWRLGLPLIDAGVNAVDGLLARISTYLPGPDAPCLECAWGAEDYRTLEQIQPCGPGRPAQPTNASLSLGTLAASLQALECGKLLRGELDAAADGRQILLDLAGHHHSVTRFRRQADCRFDHQTWLAQPLACEGGTITIGELLGQGGGNSPWFSVEGHSFVHRMRCLGCGRERPLLRLTNRLRSGDLRCRGCGEKMAPLGFNLSDRLTADGLADCQSDATLRAVGLRVGDLVTIGANGSPGVHYELREDTR